MSGGGMNWIFSDDFLASYHYGRKKQQENEGGSQRELGGMPSSRVVAAQAIWLC